MKRNIFIFYFILAMFSCKAINPAEGFGNLEKGDTIFSSMSGNMVTPPGKFKVDVSGQNPVLTWKPNPKADFYTIYFKKSSDSKYIVLPGAEKIKGERFVDVSINKAFTSGTFEYKISSIDRYGREGFVSNSILAEVVSYDYKQKASLLYASNGFFSKIEDGGTVVVNQNKIGILLKIKKIDDEDSQSPTKYFKIFRKLSTETEWVVINEKFEPSSYHSDTTVGAVVAYYVDIPPVQGVDYNYKVAPVNSINKMGESSDPVTGKVYAIPQIKDLSSFVGGVPGQVKINIILPPGHGLEHVKIYYSDKESGPWTDMERKLMYDEGSGKFSVTLSEAEVNTILGTAVYKEIFFYLTGSYGGATEKFETIMSLTKNLLVLSSSSTNLELPVLTVEHGERSTESETVSKKIKLSWNKPGDTKVTGYKIYRVRQFTDATIWGSSYAVVSDLSKNPIVWEDDNAKDFGAYFYKVNPIAGEIVENENNSDSAIGKAVIKITNKLSITPTSRTHQDKIVLTWDVVPGNNYSSLYFDIYQKTRDTADSGYAKKGDTLGVYIFTHFTNVPGYQDFKLQPKILIKKGSTVLDTVYCVEGDVASGAIDLDNINWIRYVMQTITSAQSVITGSLRDESNYNNGGVFHDRGTVRFKRRSFSSYCSNEKFDSYQFVNYAGINGGVTVAGAIYHIFFDDNTFLSWTKPLIYLSYSSTVFTSDHSASDDKNVPKTQGDITIGGLYPGKLQLWFKNQGYGERNSYWHFFPIGDYTGGELYTSTNDKKINWFSDNYGLKVKSNDSPSINHDTAYAIKRDSATDWEKIGHSAVGAIR